MSEFMGTNLEFDDFDALLTKDDLLEEPVPIEVFVRDRHYLGQPPLSEIQTEIVRYSTQILKEKTLMELMGDEAGKEYYDKYTRAEIVCEIGKGGVKDHVSRIALSYAAYLIHCLRDPIDYYDKAYGTYIDLVNMAVNAKQAQQVFFDPLKNLLMNSPYFAEVGFEPRVSEIFFFSKPVRMFSGHSEAEGWEGYETLLVVLDEISAFKAIPDSTPVLTPDGWVSNGDLRMGDYVIGRDGNPTEVVGVYPQGKKEVFELSFEDGTTARCSEDHYWTIGEYSDGRRKASKTLQLKDFKSTKLPTGNGQYRYSIPTVDAVEFKVDDPLPIDPYILGILITEGALAQGPRFTTNDDWVVQEIESRLIDGHSLSQYDSISYRIVSDTSKNYYIDAIKDLGLSCGAATKHIPTQYLHASIEDRKLLLAGLMDGDGTVARGQGSFTTVSEQLRLDMLNLCRGLGGVPTSSKHDSWYLDINNNKIIGLDKWMLCPRVPFNPFRLPRKSAGWIKHRRSLDRSIVDIKSLGFQEKMTCIKVAASDGLYVIDDFIVTHNTDTELKGDLRNKGSASQIYNMAKASVTSRFPKYGKVSLLSFPRFKNDFIESRYYSVINDIEESGMVPNPPQEGNSGVNRERKTWAVKAATWEVNPTKTEEDFADEFRRDPVQSAARFACKPPEMEDAYFRNPQQVRSSFIQLENPVDEDGTYKEWFNGKDGHTRFIHVDLGLKRDRAAVGMVHCSGLKEVQTLAGVEKLPVINMDIVKYWEAAQQEEIPLSEIRTFVVELCRMFDVGMVTFDMWSSADMIQSLRGMGINAEWHTVKKTDYDTLSTAIYDQRFRGYWDELLVEEELLKLKLINNTKIDHPSKGSKDVADSIAGAMFVCMDNLMIDTEIEVEIMGFDDDIESEENERQIIDKILPSSREDKIPEELEEWLEMI